MSFYKKNPFLELLETPVWVQAGFSGKIHYSLIISHPLKREFKHKKSTFLLMFHRPLMFRFMMRGSVKAFRFQPHKQKTLETMEGLIVFSQDNMTHLQPWQPPPTAMHLLTDLTWEWPNQNSTLYLGLKTIHLNWSSSNFTNVNSLSPRNDYLGEKVSQLLSTKG